MKKKYEVWVSEARRDSFEQQRPKRCPCWEVLWGPLGILQWRAGGWGGSYTAVTGTVR